MAIIGKVSVSFPSLTREAACVIQQEHLDYNRLGVSFPQKDIAGLKKPG